MHWGQFRRRLLWGSPCAWRSWPSPISGHCLCSCLTFCDRARRQAPHNLTPFPISRCHVPGIYAPTRQLSSFSSAATRVSGLIPILQYDQLTSYNMAITFSITSLITGYT